MKPCKEADTALHRKRPAPYPGPRCTTCHRAVLKARRLRAAQLRVEKVYGITPEQYDALYAAQGGRCACCGRATGKARRLAVDHDHRCTAGHAPETGCPECVRGLCCGPCNRLIGMLGDAPEAFERFANYLRHPPAREILSNDGTD